MKIDFQWFSFVFLAVISSYFTYSLAFELGVTPVEKIALIAGSLAIELIKLFALVHANNLLGSKRKFKLQKLWTLYGTYGFVAFYSLLASFGYALSTVDRITETTAIVSISDSVTVDKQNLEILDRSVAEVYTNIKMKQDLISALPTDNINRRLSILNMIKTDQASLENLTQRRTEIQDRISKKQQSEQAERVVKKKTMYEVIGQTIGIKAKWVAFTVLFIFALSIELGIFITSPHNFIHH